MNQVISVSQFVAIINETLGFAYPAVVVEGEVSGFTVMNQNVYFSLKDDQAAVNCYIYKPHLQQEMADGMKVRVIGAPRLLPRRGNFSLTVRAVELAGEGALMKAFELLKAKLEREGLFNANRKRPLPAFPARIGLITSTDSAAYSDFLKILAARWRGLKIAVAPVQVQGKLAPDQIAFAFKYFNQLAGPADLVVLVRGGGSLEDLQAFNTELVVRAVAGSRTPTIVGVGHERDTTLADLVADLRAATPTDAARLAVPDRRQVWQQISQAARRGDRGIRRMLVDQKRHLLSQIAGLEGFIRLPGERSRLAEASLRRFGDRFNRTLANLSQSLNRSQRQLEAVWPKRLISESKRLGYQVKLLSSFLWRPRYQLDQLAAGLRTGLAGWETHLHRQRLQIDALERLLRSANPRAVLAKGYAIAKTDGRAIKSAQSVSVGSRVMIELHQGNLDTTVNDRTS